MSDHDDQDQVNNVVFPRKLIKKFIELYRELPCLWNRNCPTYKAKAKRHEAVTRLTALVQEYDPTATRVHTMRKLESLRSCVRREYRKVKESRETAKSEDDVYEPSLWYYNLLLFVFTEGEEGNSTQQGQSNLSYENIVADEKSEAVPESEEDTAEDDQYDHSMTSYQPEYVASTLVEVAESSKRYPEYDDDSNKAKRHCTEVDDEYDAIGLNVAAKLRNLPINMRIIAEKLINDVLFQAQINALSPNSTITTQSQDPFKPDPL